MVARVTLNNMYQDQDKSILAFGARLREQAGVCKYNIKCLGCDVTVDYIEQILCAVLCRGIVDLDIQLELQSHQSGHDIGGSISLLLLSCWTTKLLLSAALTQNSRRTIIHHLLKLKLLEKIKMLLLWAPSSQYQYEHPVNEELLSCLQPQCGYCQ